LAAGFPTTFGMLALGTAWDCQTDASWGLVEQHGVDFAGLTQAEAVTRLAAPVSEVGQFGRNGSRAARFNIGRFRKLFCGPMTA
jgi:hypothetical protein